MVVATVVMAILAMVLVHEIDRAIGTLSILNSLIHNTNIHRTLNSTNNTVTMLRVLTIVIVIVIKASGSLHVTHITVAMAMVHVDHGKVIE